MYGYFDDTNSTSASFKTTAMKKSDGPKKQVSKNDTGEFLNTVFSKENSAKAEFNMMTFPEIMPFQANNSQASGDFKTRRFEGASHRKMPLSQECIANINSIAQKINCDPKDLENIIYAESGGNPHAVNPKGGATGLIQFMPKTAQSLGTSTEQLLCMTAEQQMPYVEKYLVQNKKGAGFGQNERLNRGDLYALIFHPATARQEIQCRMGDPAYDLNASLDVDHKGYITRGDLDRRAASNA